MANRYPLIYNPSANQLQELQSGDGLDLGGSNIANVVNINSTGIITATSFSGTFSGTSSLASGLTGSPSITVTGLFVSGVTTFSQDIKLGDNLKANFGDDNDLRIYHDGSNSYVEDTGTGSLYLKGSDVLIQQHSNLNIFAKFNASAGAELYFNNSKKFETVSAGATVTGSLSATSVSSSGNINVGTAATLSTSGLTLTGGINATGIVTASSFVGSGTSLTGVATLGKAAAMSLVFGG